ncbi:major capsid protein [Serratia phage vB_SmaM-Otaku]|uniref:Major capsid protein n=1 Tax=Serratia phage vB_SmaM-Otaku TaxID=2932867 RepID=A0AAE9HD97_9CAUD|nr:major capsid protein [Serratia phage vB_SmaM-Otaku]UPU16007.1 major capsid protein [Serratia phage vB_SmaM-Otaku]
MALSNMQVYNDEIVGTTIELLGQKTDLFNANSGGAIVLSSAGFRGDFSRESFFNQIASAMRRVDRYAANSAQAATALTQGELVGVKVAGGFGPVIFEPSQMTYLEEDPAAAIRAISEGFSDALLADQLNTAIAAGVAAVSGNTALVTDVSATSGLSQALLNNSHAKFGDQSQLLVTDVMTGAAYHKLIGEAITNSGQLFQAGNVTVVSILGKRIIVTDSPSLYLAGTPNKSYVLSLAASGIIVDNTSDIIANMSTSNGKQRIETTWQADYTFGLKLKGYSWDMANGGKSPTNAELATAANWDKAVAEDKHTLGTLAIADADK